MRSLRRASGAVFLMDLVGAAGGIILIWDAHRLKVLDSWVGRFFVAAVFKDLDQWHQWLISNIYGPMQQARREEFWDELNKWRGRWNGAWCVGVDWNAIRFPSERLRNIQFSSDMKGSFRNGLILIPSSTCSSGGGI